MAENRLFHLWPEVKMTIEFSKDKERLEKKSGVSFKI